MTRASVAAGISAELSKRALFGSGGQASPEGATGEKMNVTVFGAGWPILRSVGVIEPLVAAGRIHSVVGRQSLPLHWRRSPKQVPKKVSSALGQPGVDTEQVGRGLGHVNTGTTKRRFKT